MALFGLVISGLVAFVLVILGALAVLAKGSLGQTVRGFLGVIPIGNAKLWGIILVIIGLMSGAVPYATGLWANTSTAAGIDLGTPEETSSEAVTISCQFATIGAADTNAAVGNITYRADPYDNSHYYVDVTNVTLAGSGDINGTLLCQRSGDIEKSYSDKCYFKAGSYTNKQSSTDPGVYYMVTLSSGASKVTGIPAGFKQSAYINDGSVATTASNSEKSDIVWTGGSSAQAQETLGFYFVLPSATNLNYLNNQDSVDNVLVCDKAGQIARFTVNKIAA